MLRLARRRTRAPARQCGLSTATAGRRVGDWRGSEGVPAPPSKIRPPPGPTPGYSKAWKAVVKVQPRPQEAALLQLITMCGSLSWSDSGRTGYRQRKGGEGSGRSQVRVVYRPREQEVRKGGAQKKGDSCQEWLEAGKGLAGAPEPPPPRAAPSRPRSGPATAERARRPGRGRRSHSPPGSRRSARRECPLAAGRRLAAPSGLRRVARP